MRLATSATFRTLGPHPAAPLRRHLAHPPRSSDPAARPVTVAAATAKMDFTGSDLSGYMVHVAACNAGGRAERDYTPFFVGDTQAVGYLKPEFAELLSQFPAVFDVRPGAVRLSASLATPAARTAAVAGCMQSLREAGRIPGWRDELFPVTQSLDSEPYFLIERAAVSWFGLKAYGVHVNCYVEDPTTGAVKLWIARRSKTKSTWPGMLDHMVAGGLPHGISPQENVVKECEEEANVPRAAAEKAAAVGAVSYECAIPEGLKRDVLMCFDLRLPADFAPSNNDGEVEEFFLWPIERVAETVRDTALFKPNCNLVITDFLIRRGLISPGKGYLSLLRGLRAGELS